jgi:hypothetical protein
LISNNNFLIKEDPDNFDYILDLHDMASFSGSLHKKQRQEANLFLKRNRPKTIIISNTDPSTRIQTINLINNWKIIKKRTGAKVNCSEIKAMYRFLTIPESDYIKTFATYIDGILIGIFMVEIVNNGFAIAHFAKCNREPGLFPYILREVARFLEAENCRYLNIEQDHGIEGLRIHKLKYHPVAMLKKYEVYKRTYFGH